MMLDTRKIQVIFLFEFKMSHKAAENTRDIYNAFGPGTANEINIQCSGGSRSFAKETRALKMRSMEASHWKMTAIIKADPLTTTQEVAEELNVNHSTVIRHLKQTGKVRKLDKWVPHELITIRKVTVLVSRWTLYH